MEVSPIPAVQSLLEEAEGPLRQGTQRPHSAVLRLSPTFVPGLRVLVLCLSQMSTDGRHPGPSAQREPHPAACLRADTVPTLRPVEVREDQDLTLTVSQRKLVSQEVMGPTP